MNDLAEPRIMSCAELMALPLPPLAPEPANPPTWAELVQAEPRLREVEKLAFHLHWHHGSDLYWHWYAEVKAALLPLVGWEAENFTLRHSAAYDVAYDHLLHVLETGKRLPCRKANEVPA